MTVEEVIERLVELKNEHHNNFRNENLDANERWISQGKFTAYENSIVLIRKYVSSN